MQLITKTILSAALLSILAANANAQSPVRGKVHATTVATTGAIQGAPIDGTITAVNVNGTPISGNTTGGGSNVSVACTEWGSVDGPERIYEFTPGTGASLTFAVAGEEDVYDPSIYILSTLGDSNSCVVGSDDEPDVYAPAVSFAAFTPGQPYYLYVDSYWDPADPDGGAISSGPFTLTVTGSLPVSLKNFSID